MKSGIWPSLAALCVCSLPLHTIAATKDQQESKSENLGTLRKEMNKAQERFLTAYNRVNRNTDQQLSCSDSAPTGSRLTARTCSTRGQTRSQEEQARNFLGAMDTIGADQSARASAAAEASSRAQNSGAGSLSSEQTAALAGAQNPDSAIDTKSGEAANKVAQQARDFEANLQKLLDSHPELQQRYDEFLAARQRYLQAGGTL